MPAVGSPSVREPRFLSSSSSPFPLSPLQPSLTSSSSSTAKLTIPTRGALVQQFNAVTGSANGFMYMVAGLIAVYAIILLAFLFKKPGHEE